MTLDIFVVLPAMDDHHFADRFRRECANEATDG